MGHQFSPGQQLGDYEIVSVLGVGGLGAVYEARHRISNRCEALKVLLPEQLGTPDMAERFRREIQMLATLNHPAIAALHNAFQIGDQLVMVMELVRGETLSQRNQRSPLTLPAVISIATQSLAALQYAHAQGIIHRDIKPANIMIAPPGDSVKMLDFGIALSETAPHLTATGSMIGSLHYMSPEQITGGRATAQSDIYSFGVTLFELVTGKLPCNGTTNYEIMTAHLQHIPTPPSELNPAIPPAISRAIMTALAKDPASRFTSVQELATVLQSGLNSDSYRITMPIPLPPLKTISGEGAVPQQTPAPNGVARPISEQMTSAAPVESISKELAVFIGPIARIVVKRLATRCTDTNQLYTEAAKEIPSESDRAKFLLNRRR